MFNLNIKKYGIANISIKKAIISLLFIVWILFSWSCAHPICEDITPKDTTEKIRIYNMILKSGKEGKDAVVSTYYPVENFGNGKTISCTQLGGVPNQFIERGYIDFDLAEAIPSKAKVKKATLKLFADTVNALGSGLRPIGHYYASGKQWKVSIISTFWDELNISWFNRPQTDKEFAVLNGPEIASQAINIDVTEYAIKKVNREPGVYGVTFYFDYGPSVIANSTIRFCSSDHQNKELWPELHIEYER
ncbi:MAG: DNRLRE domain-containing protein [Sporocytophaga sp.]|uniref:DNRLRE domain-containing protein n=1 Tax=Sporocytophaga sp. TaxID=2231183 RepID=UPI001B219072|nr:DNRLRE domain-containing protein [Sporocytophaga sp.]MBO9699478.1 DNRLRE domain-containing protein [Sporocytophaga sp.]